MKVISQLSHKQYCRTVVMAVALSSAAGCGQGTCDIQGRVTYQGKPVVFGAVRVLDDQGNTVSARIDPEGHYAATGVRAGTVRFAVVTSGPSGTLAPSSPKANGTAPNSDSKRQPLPKQYADPESSGLTTVVTRGDNTFDIELK